MAFDARRTFMDRMRGEDLYADRQEQLGKITELEARRWKHEIFGLMLERGLEPDGLVGISEEPVPVF